MKTIDFEKVKKLSRILTGQEQPPNRYEAKLAAVQARMRNADADPGLEPKKCLFFYNRKYYFVKGELKIIAEADVQETLMQNSGTKIYFMCSQVVCPMGKAISGKKMESVKVKDDDDAVRFMTEKSGVEITKNDL